MFVCRQHPRYKGIREPMNACAICVWIWELVRSGWLRRIV